VIHENQINVDRADPSGDALMRGPWGFAEPARWLQRMRVRWLAPVLFCILATGVDAAAPVPAGGEEIDLEEIVRRPEYGNYRGYAEFKMARYASARRIWEALDERSFGEAAFNLGILYEDGLGVARDMERALNYYRRGAMLGSPKAMFRTGLLYWLGAPGVPVDRGEGRRFLSMAAAAGDSEAQRYLAAEGSTAESDDPVFRADRELAAGRVQEYVNILRVAAEAGHVRAQTRLAWSYEAGRGVPRDLALAAQWFAAAAKGGDGEAMYALAVMYGTGAGQARDARLAEEWLQRSAASGYPAARADIERRKTSR
jgi:TPR repeat protein